MTTPSVLRRVDEIGALVISDSPAARRLIDLLRAAQAIREEVAA